MQTFFWLSVVAIYAGILLALVDLLLEDFRPNSWTKIPIAGGILALGFLFTQSVVLRKDPIVVGWRFWNDRLEVYIDNASDDDYVDMDLKIKPDFPNAFISDMKQETHIPNVSFVDALPVTLTGKERVLDVLQDPILGNKSIPDAVYTNFLRFRCEKLPKNTNLKFSMALINKVGNEVIPLHSASEVVVGGSYKGRFRNYEIDQVANGMVVHP
jgi:hypothetical protein